MHHVITWLVALLLVVGTARLAACEADARAKEQQAPTGAEVAKGRAERDRRLAAALKRAGDMVGMPAGERK